MNMLKLLHPFIPFFTEFMWQENKFDRSFKFSSYYFKLAQSQIKIQSFNKSSNEIESLIEIITSIRSTKVQLNIPP